MTTSKEAAAEARHALQKARIDDHVRKVVDSAPPLNPRQVDQLRGLLAINDPVQLTRAARIVRTALDRKRATEQQSGQPRPAKKRKRTPDDLAREFNTKQ